MASADKKPDSKLLEAINEPHKLKHSDAIPHDGASDTLAHAKTMVALSKDNTKALKDVQTRGETSVMDRIKLLQGVTAAKKPAHHVSPPSNALSDSVKTAFLESKKSGWKAHFADVTSMSYAGQAKFWLNAFWADGAEKEAENVWKFAHLMIELDKKRKKDGNELPELEAHRFLELCGETHTVLALRHRLTEMDIDNNKRVALLEFLLFHYNKDVQVLLSRPQGDNKKAVEEATRKLQEAQGALGEMLQSLDAQKKALAEVKAAAERLQKAEVELQAAGEQLKTEQEAHDKTLASLEKKVSNPNSGKVAQGVAAQQLAALKGKDPIPLQKAKLSQEAGLRKVAKQRKEQEKAKVEAEEKTKVLETSVKETEGKVKEAQSLLNELKTKGGPTHGDFWWMDREIEEVQKYLPKSKQVQSPRRAPQTPH